MTLKSKAMDRYDLEVKGYGRTDIYTPLAIFVPNMNTTYQKLFEVTRLFLTVPFKSSVILLMINIFCHPSMRGSRKFCQRRSISDVCFLS